MTQPESIATSPESMTTPKDAPGHIDVRRVDGLLVLEVVNPRRYNAMSLSMWESLGQAVQSADSASDVRAVVLQGRGDRAFVSGADISEFGEQRNDPDQVARYERAVASAQNALIACRHPTIAVIRGVCMGGGMGLAVSCDLRYCNARARFRMPAARLGLGYTLAGVARMREVLGAARCADLFMTARTFDGLEAARIGLATEVFDDTDFDRDVTERVSAVGGNAPLSLRAAKLALRHLLGNAGAPSANEVSAAVQACFDSQDYQEGQTAFREKRLPRFAGR